MFSALSLRTSPSLAFADKGQPAIALHLVDKKGFEAWLGSQPERVRQAVKAQAFKAEGYQFATLPGAKPDEWSVVLGVANVDDPSAWCLAKAADLLPEGTYRVADRGPGPAVLGWLLGQYRFERYKQEPSKKGARILLTDEPARIAMSKLGRDRSVKYSTSSTALLYEERLRSLVGQDGR